MDDKLFELEVRKLIQEYKLLEIEEEWKNELINSNKDEFLREISKLKPVDKEPEVPKIEITEDSSDELEIEPKKQMSDSIKKLYREIVKLTHPDKTSKKNNRKELNDLYIRAKIAADDSNLYDLLVICDKLDIKWSVDLSDKKLLEDNLNIKKEKIKAIEGSYIWLWIRAESIEEKINIINLFIEKNS